MQQTPTFILSHNQHSAQRGQIVIQVEDPITQMHIKACGSTHQTGSAGMLINSYSWLAQKAGGKRL